VKAQDSEIKEQNQMKLSCTSVMLPRWDLDQTFDKLAEHGYDGVELRCRYIKDDAPEEPSFWGRHLADISPDNIVDRAGEIQAASKRSGVKVVALAPQALVNELDLIDKLFAGALAINPDEPPMIRIGAPRHDRTKPYHPQFDEARAGFAALTDKARDCGVKALYEIHVGTVAVSCSRTIELLKGLDTNHIGAIYDIPNMIRVGLEDSRMGMELLGPYMAHCHIGNATPVPDKAARENDLDQVSWKWDFSDLRDGVADIPQLIQDMKDLGYKGYMSLEEFGPGDDDEKVGQQGAYLRHLISG
jgi:sugar phosphate isomerase/epimerase